MGSVNCTTDIRDVLLLSVIQQPIEGQSLHFYKDAGNKDDAIKEEILD